MSNIASPLLKDFARRLLIHEAALGSHAQARGMAAFRVCEKLRQSLAKLMGIAGFRALLTRGLVLATAERPALAGLKIKPDGSLEGLAELETTLSVREIADCETVLVAHVLGLLVTFIGPTLTQEWLQASWPTMDEWTF